MASISTSGMHKQTPILIDIPKHCDARGNLSVVDSKSCLPFEIKRIFYVYDVPCDVERGGHAHFTLHQFIWPVSGVIKVSTIDHNSILSEWTLQLPWQGLYIPPLTWAYETSLSAGCVYLVAASDYYVEKDYIRDFNQFTELVQNP